jgi:hypothetical protein
MNLSINDIEYAGPDPGVDQNLMAQKPRPVPFLLTLSILMG